MSWTAPQKYVTGQLITAAMWNQHIRDNFMEVAPIVPIVEPFVIDGKLAAVAVGLTLMASPRKFSRRSLFGLGSFK